MITAKLVGQKKVIAQLTSMPLAVHNAVLQKIYKLAIDMQTYIRTQKLSGQVLNVKSGALRRSINWTVNDLGKKILAKVFSAGDVKYAGIHEYGGRTAAHDIFPKKGEALAFMGRSGKMQFAKVVHHPGSVMPERSFMRSSLRDQEVTIQRELKMAVLEGLGVAQGRGI